jgi:hypothetical protein
MVVSNAQQTDDIIISDADAETERASDFYTVPNIYESNKNRDISLLNIFNGDPLTFLVQALEANLAYIFASRYPNLNLLGKNGACFVSEYFYCEETNALGTVIDFNKTIENLPYDEPFKEMVSIAIDDFLEHLIIYRKSDSERHHIDINMAKKELTLYSQDALFKLVSVFLKATAGICDVDDTLSAEDIYEEARAEGQDLATFTLLEQERSCMTGFMSVGLLIDDKHPISSKEFRMREINRALRQTPPYPMRDLYTILQKHRVPLEEPKKRRALELN